MQRSQFSGNGVIGVAEEGQDPAGTCDGFAGCAKLLSVGNAVVARVGDRCRSGEGGDVCADLIGQVLEVSQAGLGLSQFPFR